MLLKVKIDWVQNKKLTKEEQEQLDAKIEVLGSDYEDSYEDRYDEVEKLALIDTENNKMYVEVEDNKVCLTRLLTAEYIPTSTGNVERIEERLYINTTLVEIEKQLTK